MLKQVTVALRLQTPEGARHSQPNEHGLDGSVKGVTSERWLVPSGLGGRDAPTCRSYGVSSVGLTRNWARRHTGEGYVTTLEGNA